MQEVPQGQEREGEGEREPSPVKAIVKKSFRLKKNTFVSAYLRLRESEKA